MLVNATGVSVNGPDLTPFVQYTPTLTGFGTPTGVSIWSRRVGDSLEIRGRFTSGTATAVEAQMTLGFNGVSGNVTSSATKVPTLQVCGYGAFDVVAAVSGTVLIESGVGYITFGVQGLAAGMTKATGSGFTGNTTTFAFFCTVPIAGW